MEDTVGIRGGPGRRAREQNLFPDYLGSSRLYGETYPYVGEINFFFLCLFLSL